MTYYCDLYHISYSSYQIFQIHQEKLNRFIYQDQSYEIYLNSLKGGFATKSSLKIGDFAPWVLFLVLTKAPIFTELSCCCCCCCLSPTITVGLLARPCLVWLGSTKFPVRNGTVPVFSCKAHQTTLKRPLDHPGLIHPIKPDKITVTSVLVKKAHKGCQRYNAQIEYFVSLISWLPSSDHFNFCVYPP